MSKWVLGMPLSTHGDDEMLFYLNSKNVSNSGGYAVALAFVLIFMPASKAYGQRSLDGPRRWSTISDTKLPSKNAAPAPQPTPGITKNVQQLVTRFGELPMGSELQGNRFTMPSNLTRRTPFQYVGRLFNEFDGRALWGTATIIRGKKILTAKHLVQQLLKRADNGRGDLILELPTGEMFRVTESFATGLETPMLAQDLAVCKIVPVNPIGDATLIAGADWRELPNEDIGSRVFLTGFDMDVATANRIELIGRVGTTRLSTIYRNKFRNVGRSVGEGIAGIGDDTYDLMDSEKGRWRPSKFLGMQTLNSAILGGLLGEFGASQAQYYDDCVWLSADMVCTNGANGAPIWVQENSGAFVIVGVQSEPSGNVAEVCGGTRIYPASSEDGSDSGGKFIDSTN